MINAAPQTNGFLCFLRERWSSPPLSTHCSIERLSGEVYLTTKAESQAHLSVWLFRLCNDVQAHGSTVKWMRTVQYKLQGIFHSIFRCSPAGNAFMSNTYWKKYDPSLGKTKKHTAPPSSFDLILNTGLRRIMSSQWQKVGHNWWMKSFKLGVGTKVWKKRPDRYLVRHVKDGIWNNNLLFLTLHCVIVLFIWSM